MSQHFALENEPAEGVCVLAWCQGNVLMEHVRPMLDESGHQDVKAGAHMEGLNCSCSCRIQTQLHKAHATTSAGQIWTEDARLYTSKTLGKPRIGTLFHNQSDLCAI